MVGTSVWIARSKMILFGIEIVQIVGNDQRLGQSAAIIVLETRSGTERVQFQIPIRLCFQVDIDDFIPLTIKIIKIKKLRFNKNYKY